MLAGVGGGGGGDSHLLTYPNIKSPGKRSQSLVGLPRIPKERYSSG